MKVFKTMALAFGLMALTTVQAQKIGIRAGVNIATVTGKDASGVDPLTSFYAGVFKEFSVVPQLFFIQPELQYSIQGYKANDTNYTLGYLNLPVMARVYFLKTISLEAGPQVGYKVNDNLENNDNINSFDTSVAGGLGFNFPLGLSLNARYVHGLTKIDKDADIKHQVIQLGASFKF
ncbi:PorT family protein [Flavobacterium sp. CYK-55]|uniref:porin family protein n=1 Tax=Flavobacterium sp. CYK-55 TaxID=2835529 RepID=UPI001BCA94A0|nr:porin family protein [Flavobacterium sp. CYK-55]MBS7787623.1 PorT family protein [Flavobacterium sp. CYK-55]